MALLCCIGARGRVLWHPCDSRDASLCKLAQFAGLTRLVALGY